MFAVLAIVFALGFVLLGVGSGSSGIGDYLSNGFNSLFGSGGTDAVKSAQNEVEKHPGNAQDWQLLATALAARSRTDEAIAAMEKYVSLRPNDADGLRQLASLYQQKASQDSTTARAAQVNAGGASSDSLFAASPLKQGASALQPNAIASAVQGAAARSANNASLNVQATVAKAIAVYQKIAALSPKDASVQVELAQFALSSGDLATAVAAFRKALALDPNGQYAAAIRQELKQLAPSAAKATTIAPKSSSGSGAATPKK